MHAATITRPPGPRGLLGPALAYRRDAMGLLERMAEYGAVSYTRFGGFQTYVISEPAGIEHVLRRNRKNYRRSPFNQRFLKDLLGEGLLTSEGASWREQRKLMAPAFHHRRIQGYAQTMVALTERAMDGWRHGEVRQVDHDMRALTLAIAVQTLFGTSEGADADRVGDAFTRVSDYFADVVSQPLRLPRWVPTPARRTYLRARAELDEVVHRIIAKRRETGQSGDDLLSMLLESRDEDGRGMADDQLRDEVLTLLLAGHETTALTMTYIFHLLAEHPEADARLADELAALDGQAPTLADRDQLVFTTQVVKEAMRLFPPAAVIARQAVEADEIDGWHIPAGALTILPIWVVHRDPRIFDRPGSFRPERWTPSFEKALPRYAYFPFGGGPRICIGKAFAMLEATLVLATIASRFRLDAVRPGPLELVPSVTIRPRDPVSMTLLSRR